MIDYLSGPVVHEAFFKKYASKKFLKGKSAHSLLFHIPTNIDQHLLFSASGPRTTLLPTVTRSKKKKRPPLFHPRTRASAKTVGVL
jgi:hypothetical protein